jgi:hypothetical protein
VKDDQATILAPALIGPNPSTASGRPRVVVVDGPPRGTPCLSTNSSLTPRIVHAEPPTRFPELITSVPLDPKIFPEKLVAPVYSHLTVLIGGGGSDGLRGAALENRSTSSQGGDPSGGRPASAITCSGVVQPLYLEVILITASGTLGVGNVDPRGGGLGNPMVAGIGEPAADCVAL